ncbi:MAG TPA: hypothetical protein VGS21_11185 [Acidimicrobiales bacterium]|nr:hypothetical protein [Acidimicrobiales bacterium]
MRLLVMGGTAFVGRHVVAQAVERGHRVTTFNRGRTPCPDIPGVERLHGDRNDDLSALSEGAWDATLDTSAYLPRHVRSFRHAVGGRSGHYTFISSVSVYQPSVPAGFTEDAQLLPPSFADELTMELYGELKVGCELAARELFGEQLAIVRPGYIVGPLDYSHRFTYWVERCAAGGTVLGPLPDQPMQVIDARDLAGFLVSLSESSVADTFHTVAPFPALTFRSMLDGIAAAVTPAGGAALDVRWHEPDALLPLSDTEDSWALMTADPARAVAAGLSCRPLAETVADTLDWVTEARSSGYEPRPGVGMPPEREAEILASLQ